jgi:hypothetical protein
MLSDEQIKQKWIECTKSHRRGDVISSVDMAIDLARWVECEARIEGARLGLEAAAKFCDKQCDAWYKLENESYIGMPNSQLKASHKWYEADDIRKAIRALDPAQVAGGKGTA